MATASDSPAPAGTRDRILHAAAELATEEGGRLSVRAVAARAGVGSGTLRHHFPTQRALLDAVLAAVYQEALPDDRIRDASLPGPTRLRESLRHLLSPVGLGDDARAFWDRLFRAFVGPDADDAARGAYPAMSREARARVESWLAVLVTEGVLAQGDNAARARYLVTVINGLALERALPSDLPALEAETEVLDAAIGSLPWRMPADGDA